MMMTGEKRQKPFILASWLILLVFGWPTNNVLARAQCITNLTEIALTEVFVTDTSIRREYILCPNTFFSLGVFDEANSITAGFFPLAFFGNTTIKCGNDGRRSNNCVLGNGDLGMLLAPFARTTDGNVFLPLDFGESFIEGVTVDDIFTAPVFMQSAFGSITFKDCGFVNSIAEPNIQLVGLVSSARRLGSNLFDVREHGFIPLNNGLMVPNFKKIPGAIMFDDYHDNRALQDLPSVFVTFVGCLFQDNIGPRQFSMDSGLTMIIMPQPGVDLVIRRSIFSNNNFGQFPLPNPQAISKSLITSFGGSNSIVLTDNCFLNNQATNFGLVSIIVGDSIQASGNFIDPPPNTMCNLIAQVDSGFNLKQCLFDSEMGSVASCQAEVPTLAPSASPTMAPTPLPTPVPTPVPTMAGSPAPSVDLSRSSRLGMKGSFLRPVAEPTPRPIFLLPFN